METNESDVRLVWVALSGKSVGLGSKAMCLSIAQVIHATYANHCAVNFTPKGKSATQSCCHWFTGSLGTGSPHTTGGHDWAPLLAQARQRPTRPLPLYLAESGGRTAKLASRVTPDLESLCLLAHNSKKASFWHFNYFLVLLYILEASLTLAV